MKTDNLGRWIDELAASIEDLEKRINKINITPVGNVMIDDLGSDAFSAETDRAVVYMPEGKLIDDYSYFIITIYQSSSPYLWTTRMIDPHIIDDDNPIGNMAIDGNGGEWTVHISRSSYGSPESIDFEMLQAPASEEVQTQGLIVNIKGFKVSGEQTTQQRTLLQKAAAAVKKATTRKSKKGGTKNADK